MKLSISFTLLLAGLSLSANDKNDCQKAIASYQEMNTQCDPEASKLLPKIPTTQELNNFCEVRKCYTDTKATIDNIQSKCSDQEKKEASNALVPLLMWGLLCTKNSTKGYCYPGFKQYSSSNKGLCECTECGEVIYQFYSDSISKIDPKVLSNSTVSPPSNICNPSKCPADFTTKKAPTPGKSNNAALTSMAGPLLLLVLTSLASSLFF